MAQESKKEEIYSYSLVPSVIKPGKKIAVLRTAKQSENKAVYGLLIAK